MRRSGGLLVALVACGGGGSAPRDAEPTTIDGAAADAAAPDAPDPDASPNAVSVTTMARCCDGVTGTPVEGVTVLVGDATTTTDADGHATVAVEPGDSVTVVYPTNGDLLTSLVTVHGVEAGDDLRFGEHFGEHGDTIATATVTWPAQTGQTSYVVNDGCSRRFPTADATSAAIYAYERCGMSSTDVLVYARAEATPLRWAYLDDFTLTPGGTMAMPAFQDATPVTATLSGIPAEATVVVVAAVPVIGREDSLSVSGQGTPSAAAFTATGTWTHAETHWFEATIVANGTYPGQKRVAARGGPVTGATSLVWPPSPPWIDGIALELDNRRVTWTESPGAQPDYTLVELTWFAPLGLGGRFPEYRWRLVAPPGTTSVSWPAGTGFEPTESDFVVVEITLIDLDGILDYDAVRALPEHEIADPGDRGAGISRDYVLSIADADF